MTSSICDFPLHLRFEFKKISFYCTCILYKEPLYKNSKFLDPVVHKIQRCVSQSAIFDFYVICIYKSYDTTRYETIILYTPNSYNVIILYMKTAHILLRR